MSVQAFLTALADKPKFYILICPDSELRSVYIKLFTEAHGGKPVYRDTVDIGKQPRTIGPKPVYIVLDYEPVLKKPSAAYKETSYPVLVLFTKEKTISTAMEEVYADCLAEIPSITGEQATAALRKNNVPEYMIEYLKAKTSTTQEAILVGKQLMSLATELGIPAQQCLDLYFRKALDGRNEDEEPTEFLQGILTRNYQTVFYYLQAQLGNELFVFSCLLNWIQDMIKFCSCGGQYWEEGGLVAAKYNPFKQAKIIRIPFIKLVRLHEFGLKTMQSIKLNEPDPSAALEVFVCRIIQTLA